jgi:SAM-dependent methyltransferase
MVAYKTLEDFRDVVYMFQRSRIILSGFELGIFTVIGDDKKTSAEVSNIIKSDARATDRLMNALVVCGLLEKQNNLFSNGEFAARQLVQGKPDYLAGFGHSVNMWNTWSQLTEAVRIGHTMRTGGENAKNWNESFIAAMHERSSKQAPDLVAKLELTNVKKMLDVGGGSGAYSIAFVKARPDLHAVVFDLPNILSITQKYLVATGTENNISTLPGNYNSDDPGSGYDLVFMSAIVHINSPEENQSLVNKCAQALNPGGQLIIQDHIMDADRISPETGVFFALNMLVATQRGDTYTEGEIKGWMTNAGLKDFTRIETFNNAMIIGFKAGKLSD